MFFHLFLEVSPIRALPVKAHRPRSSPPGNKRSRTIVYASMMALSLFAHRCRIRRPYKAQFERSVKSLLTFWSANLSLSRPSHPPLTLQRLRGLLPSQSMFHQLKALQRPPTLRVNTRRYIFPNHRRLFPNPLKAESINTPGFRLFPVTLTMPLVPLGNTLSCQFPQIIPALDLPGNTLNVSPLPRVLSAILTPVMSMSNPLRMKMLLLMQVTIPHPPLLVLSLAPRTSSKSMAILTMQAPPSS